MKTWDNFFIAEAGAAAVLAGLIFVGISINLQKIIARQMLSRAAWVCLLTLMEVFLVSSFMLIPAQPLAVLGIEVEIIALVCWVVISIMTFSQLARSREEHFAEAQAWYARLLIILLSQFITLPFVIAGLLLLLQISGGVYLVAPGILSALPYSLYMGWVLTVEVNR